MTQERRNYLRGLLQKRVFVPQPSFDEIKHFAEYHKLTIEDMYFIAEKLIEHAYDIGYENGHDDGYDSGAMDS